MVSIRKLGLLLLVLLSVGCENKRAEWIGDEQYEFNEVDETFLATCGEQIRPLYTDPWKVTATLPSFVSSEIEGAPTLAQEPRAGTALAPGEHRVKITKEDEFFCERTVNVILDPDSVARPTVELIPPTETRDVPKLKLGELKDNLGNPIEVSIAVDGETIPGLDLAAAPALRMRGHHVITFTFADAFGRSKTYWWWSWFQKKGEVPPGVPEGIGVADDCTCELVEAELAQNNCEPPADNPGDGNEDYACDGQHLTHFSNEVSDFAGGPDSHSSADAGGRDFRYEIKCEKQGAEVQNCTTCCSEPLIIITAIANIGSLRAYAENSDERALLKIAVKGSGIGNYSIQSFVASGFQNYTFKVGAEVGASAGLSADSEGPGAEGSVEVSTASERTYSGTSWGWQSESPKSRFFTGWASSCTKRHRLEVDFNSDLLANDNLGLATVIFGVAGMLVSSDSAESQLSDNANIVITDIAFRCDGKSPTIGQE